MSVILYQNLEKTCAHTEVVGAALEKAARQVAAKAQADLNNKAAHPYSRGYSYVSMTRGRLDRYVILTDRDEDQAPWMIGAGKRSGGKIAILLDAAGIGV